jgi:hypothetical protein
MLGLSGLWVHEHRTATGTHQMQTRLRHALSAVGKESPLALRLRVRLAGEIDYLRQTRGNRGRRRRHGLVWRASGGDQVVPGQT